MKYLIISAAILMSSVFAASAQSISCLMDISPPGENAIAGYPAAAAAQRVHKAEWVPVTPVEKVQFAIAGGSWHAIQMHMPVRGLCVGSFEVLNGQSVEHSPIDSNGDIELMVLEMYQFDKFKSGRPFTARYSSGRSAGGKFKPLLDAGRYVIVMSNRHSATAGTNVKFVLGESQ